MPGMSGLELVAEMSNRGIDCPVIMMTGYRSTEKKRRASELGVVDYLEKPVKSDDLVAGLKKALAPPMP
jgi:two-component system response regulator YesN